MATISEERALAEIRVIAEIIDPQCWEVDQNHRLTHNMCYRREDSTRRAVAILALVKEFV